MMSLESLLIWRCAPVFAGIKPASLVAFSKKEFVNANDEIALLAKSEEMNNLYFKTVCRCEEKMLFFVYRKDLLEKTLSLMATSSWLSLYGYDECASLEKKIDLLFERLSCSCTAFPHEIGVFLGYPIEDVKGFVENGGQGAKYCGYWKVYGDEKCAKKTFSAYKKCFSLSERLAKDGVSLSTARILLSA